MKTRLSAAASRQKHLALLLHPEWGVATDMRTPEARLEEAEALIIAAGLQCAASKIVSLPHIRKATLFGSGKLDELAVLAKEQGAGVVVVNCALAPVQQRNLEEALGAKVLDRTGLIIEIFARRAQTAEASLQVELASLAYQKNRLVRFWTHLERQRGGGGFLAGPGERQIESDRRQITSRITRLSKKLTAIRARRTLHRQARARAGWHTIALAGYTNAGKSTLFSKMTRALNPARAALFDTLDPSMRACTIPNGGAGQGGKIILADTVGFISGLPPQLIAAFRATLEEVEEASLILHVRDVSHPDTLEQKKDVETVLEEMGITPCDDRIILEVLNKIDRLQPDQRRFLLARDDIYPVSAKTGEGLDALFAAIIAKLNRKRDIRPVNILLQSHERGKALAFLRQRGQIVRETVLEDGSIRLDMRMPATALNQFRKYFPLHSPPHLHRHSAAE